MNIQNFITGTILLTAIGFTSCKKEYDTPPLPEPVETSTMTIGELREWQATTGGKISIKEDISVYGIVTMDENDGNVYKNVYMQDASGAVNVRMLNGGGLYQGDSIRIWLNGTVLNKYNGVLQIDSVDVDKHVFKQNTNINYAPEVVNIDEITALKESELIQINNVQFIQPELGGTFADGEELVSLDRTLEDEAGNTIIVRTSGYASFAEQELPTGSGSIVCIVSHFNGNVQLLIRSYAEINMNNERFPGILHLKNFDDGDVFSGGWMTYKVTGEIDWETSSAGGAATDYGVISNYEDGANYATENWLISPEIDLTAGDSPVLNFDNAYSYMGTALELYACTDYDGVSDPNSSGSWVPLSAVWSGGSFVWVNSGDVSLEGVISSTTRIAFKYEGSASDGSTWELDNIVVRG
jgi:hypothetical protein